MFVDCFFCLFLWCVVRWGWWETSLTIDINDCRSRIIIFFISLQTTLLFWWRSTAFSWRKTEYENFRRVKKWEYCDNSHEKCEIVCIEIYWVKCQIFNNPSNNLPRLSPRHFSRKKWIRPASLVYKIESKIKYRKTNSPITTAANTFPCCVLSVPRK